MNPIDRRSPTLLIARRNLSRTKVRSALAMLGIAIGVVAIASLGVFGAMLSQSVTGSLGDIGDQIVVNPASEDGSAEPLTDREVREITRVSGDASVVPVKQGVTQVSFRGERARTTVYGMTDPATAYEADRGRIPVPFRSGALVGSELAQTLGVSVGDSLTVGNRRVRVVAVLEASQGFSTVDPDSAVVLAERDVAGAGYDSVIVTAVSGQRANDTAVAIREALNDRHERVRIVELGRIVDQIRSVFDAINLFLMAIASISLLVAGVSILNVMLMSTIVRREEIGVLRAVGYQQRDVLKIMLSEALLLGIAGGVAGAVLSLVGGLTMAQLLLGDPTALFTPTNGGYILGAFVFGVLTSVVSGFYPAKRAAAEEPVDALRG
jgi:putative ABC transport system permease protein